jgi:hypothetical protein
MTPDTLPESDFFSAAAVIAGTLWAITTLLFSLITGSIKRSGLLNRIGIDLLLLVSSVFIITISTLFLGAMLISLSMLVVPPGPRALVQGIPGWLAVLSLLGAIVFTALLSSQTAPERLGKAQRWLIACCFVCLIIIVAVGTGSTCIAHAQDPDFGGRVCRALGFNDPRADSIVVVVLAITAGCLLSLLLGIASMQTELSEAPKPPDGDAP